MYSLGGKGDRFVVLYKIWRILITGSMYNFEGIGFVIALMYEVLRKKVNYYPGGS